jgi:hypothetical protein
MPLVYIRSSPCTFTRCPPFPAGVMNDRISVRPAYCKLYATLATLNKKRDTPSSHRDAETYQWKEYVLYGTSNSTARMLRLQMLSLHVVETFL